MEGNVRNISEYLRGATKLIIPVYQRNYDWKKENCERLLDDLVTLHKDSKLTHFFGSIVVKPGNFSQEVIVIDGQQRITTITLLFLAMKNYMLAEDISGERINPTNINETFLINTFSSDPDKQKLVPNPRDFDAYKKLYGDSRVHIQTSNITMNYNYFYNRLSDIDISLDELFESINKLQVMVVNLNSPDDDPQLIFESLNSTGVDLTNADKIRNYLLMNEDQTTQMELFSNYWEPIEERTHLKMSEFFKDYLTLKEGKSPVLSKVYESFVNFYSKREAHAESNEIFKKEFFKELAEYSIVYEQILKFTTNNKKINDFLNRLEEINITVARPFIMAILKELSLNELEENEVLKIFNIIESYLGRRVIVGIASNALNKIFASLYKDLEKHRHKSDETVSSSDIIAYLILQKQSTGRIPSNVEVTESLKSRNMYNISTRIRTYVFERLENHGHVENLNIYEGIQNQDYSVEHIMPQTLTAKWKEDLGENYQEVHDLYINSIGNLTLTGYNSKYSNRPFKEKQTIEKGFIDSHFSFLNRLPAQKENWGEKEIIERREMIIDRALDIWEMPETNYQPVTTDQEMVIFDGTQTFLSKKVKGYTFLNDDYQAVSTWKEFLIDIIRTLAERDINIIMGLVKSNEPGLLETKFSSNPNHETKEILPGIHLVINYDNLTKMRMINRLFELYEVDNEELSVDIFKN